MKTKKIFLLESYYGGSHKYWADGLSQNSSYSVKIFSLPARFWKWRMQGSAITFTKILDQVSSVPDLFIISDMIDLALFKSLNPRFKNIPIILYMHENQLTYPYSNLDKQKDIDLSYGYLNYKSCLVADQIVFNSHYHMRLFISAITSLLQRMPDSNNLWSVGVIEKKSIILPIGFDFKLIDKLAKNTRGNSEPTILWNHRWDEDKNPEGFIDLLTQLKRMQIKFKIIATTPNKIQKNKSFEKFKRLFADNILSASYINDYEEYIKVISKANILPVTSLHDFFGISVIEAIRTGCTPLLPTDLVYKEYLDHSDLFYNSKKELLELLVEIINGTFICEPLKLSRQLDKFDWKVVITKYDRLFDSIS